MMCRLHESGLRAVSEAVCVYLDWRRRADSNRRIGVLQTPALDRLATSPCSSPIYYSIAGSGAEGETRTPTAKAATAPSTLRVYQFHHLGIL